MILNDFLSLFYPRLCAGCQTSLVRGEEVICLGCLADLPKTGFEKIADNQVSQLFWGRADIRLATSFCSFDKGGIMQHLMHQLKYKGSREVGVKLGNLFGTDLIRSAPYRDIELLVPVPLHPKRERTRGYNQSAEIGKGISAAIERPLITGNLVRNLYSNSQTNKSRFERWQNVKELFGVRNPEILEGRHLLLVDDVVTTGSTLEACAQVLLKIPGTTVSIATIACA
ncbi:MAG TPA: ComF family protein [Prolixibacteraceae bacterium]|nr:ComF family protein [Prolixibacteraceae bacterium]